jgi:hypothetical protein
MTAVAPAAPGWLKSRPFDYLFTVGIAAVALASGALVVAEPRLFWPVLMADLWLLGYPHVIATWTRIAMDGEGFARHRVLALGLPVPILLGTVALAAFIGIWAVATIYLYWQWFHYTRQSWGIVRAYGRKAGTGAEDACAGRLFWAAFYGVPLWGILARSAQAPAEFLGMPIWVLPVPALAANAVGVAALGTLALWLVKSFTGKRPKRLTTAQALYLACHYTIFTFGYLAIPDITVGWLVINIWHNAQYMLFVWMFNTRRFEGGIHPQARLLSWLSQPGRAWAYALFCVGLAGAIYFGLLASLKGFEMWALPISLIVFQTVNFHHYIVDGIIWKTRSPAPPNIVGKSAGSEAA